MNHIRPHLGATVRDARTNLTGRLDWVEHPAAGRLAVVVTQDGTHHKVGYRYLTMLEPRGERLPVSEQRLNGHHAVAGYGITTAAYAELWVEPKVLEVAA